MPTIVNALLETGYSHLSSGAVRTDTTLATITHDHGTITAITPQHEPLSPPTGAWDADQRLLIPPTKDFHIHLDKGHFGGPWQAVIPVDDGVRGRIREEQAFLPTYLDILPDRATALLRHIADRGTTFLRVQVNVDPTIGLQNYEIVKDVLAGHADRVTSELVAFPQHGTLATEAEGWLTRAMEAGAPILGGLDPHSIDGDIEASLTCTFDLATRFGREIDIHLHDSGPEGIHTIQRIIDYTREHDMAGRVAISHALALGSASNYELGRLAENLAAQRISIFTTQPISCAGTTNVRTVPWPNLLQAGVRVRVINDNVNDHWSPFGSGDLIERASRAAEIYRQSSEIDLANAYALVSDGILPLGRDGQQLWPKVGDEASFLAIRASCLSEVVARIPQDRRLIIRGVPEVSHP